MLYLRGNVTPKSVPSETPSWRCLSMPRAPLIATPQCVQCVATCQSSAGAGCPRAAGATCWVVYVPFIFEALYSRATAALEHCLTKSGPETLSSSVHSCAGPKPWLRRQVWTYRSRVAVVLSVTHKGQPIQDALKLQRLQQLLFDMMDRQRHGIVTIKTVRRPSIPAA